MKKEANYSRGYKHAQAMSKLSKPKGLPKQDDKLQRGDIRGLADCLDLHLERLQVLNYSPKTIDGRKKALVLFINWAQQRDLFAVEQITKPILERYQAWLSRKRKPNAQVLGWRTQRNYLEHMREYFRWLCREDYLPSNPASELELPRPQKTLPPNPLSIAEVTQVLSQPNINDELGIRDRAILELFYATGIRRSELAHLQISDINLEQESLRVTQGKGKKERILPIGKGARDWLDCYLQHSRNKLVVQHKQNSLFLTGFGEGFNPDTLTRLVKAYIKQANIGRSGSCHLLRHTMAHHMLENGADIRYIQQMLGHADLNTTQIYTEVSIKQLQHVHQMTHPSNAMKPVDSTEAL